MSKSKDNKQTKETKAKTPNAYEINPQMMQGLAEITPQNLPFFLFSNPEIVPEHFNKKFQKNLKSFFSLAGLDTLGGVALNMIATRTLPQILILHPAIRIPLRLVIQLVPFAVTYPKLSNYYQTHDEMFEQQYIKIQKLRKTGNI